MEIIEAARLLGKAIQESDAYTQMDEARKKSDKNMELQEKISNFNLKKIALNREATRQERDNEKITKLDKEMREIYQQIMVEEDMINYSTAKNKMDNIMKKVEYLLAISLNGEDPLTAEIPESSGCSGNCSSCSSCN